MSVSDNQMLLNSLELLYKRINDDPASPGVDRAIIQATLQISPKQIDDSLSYLAERNLVALTGAASGKWTFAKITAEGIEVIENKERYANKFLFAQSSSQIHEEDREKVFRTVETRVSLSDQVADVFKQASDQVLSSKLSSGEKRKIEKQLKSLEKELLKSKKADLKTIQKEWERLKKTAGWLSPTVAPVMLEGIRIALDLPTSL